MTVRMYDSTHVGAPVLTGQAGSLKALLKAILVDGFNSTAVTITRTGDWATVAHNAHGLPAYVSPSATPDTARKVLIAGANEVAYNGEQVVYRVDANSYKYLVAGSPATPATGSITAKRPSFGWANVFESGNKLVVRPPAGTRMYLRLDDAGTSQCRARGYEAMTDVDTGTNPYPTDAQISGGEYWGKSTLADATARPWFIIGTERGFYIVVNTASDADWSNAIFYMFRDLKSYRVGGDPYANLIVGHTAANSTTNNGCSSNVGQTAGFFMPRNRTQSGTSVGCGYYCPLIGTNQMGRGGQDIQLQYTLYNMPSLNMARLIMNDGGSRISRGEIPGLWSAEQAYSYTNGYTNYTTFAGRGNLAGRTFILVKMGGSNPDGGVFFETSDTWDELG